MNDVKAKLEKVVEDIKERVLVETLGPGIRTFLLKRSIDEIVEDSSDFNNKLMSWW